MNVERDIDCVVEKLRNCQDGTGCAVFIGSGCSVTAGIPTAPGIVRYIQDKYEAAAKHAASSVYPDIMSVLSSKERRDVIEHFVSKAKINWAHIALAQLMTKGYVTRVLTTNFDPLVARACAMLNHFPAIYDFGTPQKFLSSDIHRSAVFHLHGQYTGFRLKNTHAEVNPHKETIRPVLKDSIDGRPIFVVGYSGESDPVFDLMADVEDYSLGLFWIGYGDGNPPKHVQERLLSENKSAYFVRGYDADTFFIELGRQLGVFPPDFVRTPFSFLLGSFESLAPFPDAGKDGRSDIMDGPRDLLRKAVEEIEVAKKSTLAARAEVMAGDLEGALREVKSRDAATETTQSFDEDSKLMEAFIYSEQALAEEDDIAAAELFDKADAIYREITAVVPTSHQVFFDWGVLLIEQAGRSSGDDALSLFAQAGEKYQQAVAIRPDLHEAFNNWGLALVEQAKRSSGAKALGLFALAREKYALAIAIKPDYHKAFNNWGNALAEQAKRSSGAEALALLTQAGEKYALAIAIKPDYHKAFSNWGLALAEQAERSSGDAALALFAQAGEKCEQAIDIKPDDHKAFNNWGNALLIQATRTDGDKRVEFLRLAREKCEQAEAIQPGSGSYNLACVSALEGKEDECRSWLMKAEEHGKLPGRAHLVSDTDLDSVRGAVWFQELLASLGNE